MRLDCPRRRATDAAQVATLIHRIAALLPIGAAAVCAAAGCGAAATDAGGRGDPSGPAGGPASSTADASAAGRGTSDAGAEAAAGDDVVAAAPGDAGPYYPLGMNDVTILAPLPAAIATPVLLVGGDVADD